MENEEWRMENEEYRFFCPKSKLGIKEKLDNSEISLHQITTIYVIELILPILVGWVDVRKPNIMSGVGVGLRYP